MFEDSPIARAPLFASLLAHTLEALPEDKRALILSYYERESPAFFAEAEQELERILRVDGRTLEACLCDLDAFNSLTEETENDAWYDQRAAFVSMHLDFLLLGFSRRRLDKIVEHLSPSTRSGTLPASASICDVGSGCGRQVTLLLRDNPGWRATLIDRSRAAKDYAEQILHQQGMTDRTAVVTGDLLSLPAEDASFDIVIAAEVLEHTSDAKRAASELVRVLRVGGLLSISLPIDLSIGMHPVVFKDQEDIMELFSQFPLRIQKQEMVRPVQGLDAICDVFPGFEGCFHATFQKVEAES